MNAMPITAWEQGAIVAMFIVFVGGLLAWMDRQLQNVRKAQQTQQVEWQRFLSEENEKWQMFIKDERLVSATSRKDDRDKIDLLTTSLNHLTEIVVAFHVSFSEHVASEDAKFDMMLDAKAKSDLANRLRQGKR